MRRLFNPITLFVTVSFVTVTTVALVSTAASAKGPAASPKSRNAASAHQPAEKPPNDKPAVSNGSPRRGGALSIVHSGNGVGNSIRMNAAGARNPDNVTNSGNGVGNRSINGLPIVDHQPSPGPVSEPGRINGLPVIGGPQGGARNPGNGVVTGVFHTLPVNPGNGVVTGVFHTLPVNPPGSNPPKKNGIPPVYHPPGSGNHPTPPAGMGTTTVTYFGSSVPVTAESPTADNSAAATTNVAADNGTARLTNIPAGATIKLDGSDFGAQPGRVTIVAGNMILPTDVVSWTEKSVNLTLPQIEMTVPMQAKFVVHRANGSVAIETPFQLCDLAR